jgi:hypothetical protein
MVSELKPKQIITLIIENESLNLWGDKVELEVAYHFDYIDNGQYEEVVIEEITLDGVDVSQLEDQYSDQIIEAIINN